MDLSEINRKIRNLKPDTDEHPFNESNAKADPFEQFILWFTEALLSEKCNPTPMVLATLDENGVPDTRVVLLKEIGNNQLIFYTNYQSKKAQQISHHNTVAANFHWREFGRQVRIKGKVEKVARSKSEAYFATRPREAQLAAHASHQSAIIKSPEVIANQMKLLAERFENQTIPCPEHWGGYALVPHEYEFFQGRKWRTNDRLFYTREENTWKMVRLSP